MAITIQKEVARNSVQTFDEPGSLRPGNLRKNVAGVVMLVASLAGSTAFAQIVDVVAPRSASTLRNPNPAPITDDAGILGGFYPSVTIAVARQSNVFRTRDNPKSDTFITVSPALAYRREGNSTDLTVRYQGAYSSHNNFSSENAFVHTLRGDLGLDMTEKLQANLGASFLDGREQRGSLGSRTFVGSEPDHYREYALDAGVTYGRRENTIQLEGTVGISRLRFVNNGQEERDRDANAIGGRIYYNVGPRTSLFAGIDRTNIDYIRPLPGFNLDSTETSYYVGGRWDASEATAAEVTVGKTKKKFDDPALGDFNGTTYAGRINWAPAEYSVFSLYGARSVEETTDLASDYITDDMLGVNWNHALTDRWNVNAFYQQGKDTFSNGRSDKYKDYGAGVNYGFANWLLLGARYSRSERTSSVDEANYVDDLLMFTMTSNFGYSGR